MPDAISLTVVGTLALTEGIKFFYAQASEILKRWSARREAAKKEQAEAKKTEPANVQLPEVFQGQLSAPEIHFDEVERLREPLLELRSKLANYADGMLPVKEADLELLDTAGKLRLLLEAIYQQRITFKGENRERSGTRVTTRIKVDDVRGSLTGSRLSKVSGVEVDTQLDIGTVGPTGEVIGTDIGEAKGNR